MRRLLPVFLLIMGCSGRDPRSPLNVLIITMDTTRADALGVYGCKSILTPSADRLAREGALFTQAYAPVPLTLPSHCTLMTGLYPPGHGVRNNGNYSLGDVTTLADLLSTEGYSTAAFVSAFVLDSQFGLARGFDSYFDSFSEEVGERQGYFGCVERGGDEITDLACEWLESSQQPFFLWLHYFDPHYPYQPPAPFDSLYNNPYLGEIAFVDSCIGRVLEKLEKQGFSERTLVVLTSDHGESLGEHGENSHGLFLYGATTRVPLIMRLSSVVSPGVRIDDCISLADVLPTVCDILGVDVPEEVQGRSMTSLFSGDSGADVPVYLETLVPLENFGWSEITGVIHRGWKYYRVPYPELYNMAEDPGETLNLSHDQARIRMEMEDLLSDLEKDLSLNRAISSRIEPDSETRKKLEQLGYVWNPTPGDGEKIDPKLMVQIVNQMEQALLYVNTGKFEGAEGIFQSVLEIDPDNIMAHNHLGALYLITGRENEALSHWRKVIELNPQFADARRNLARLLRGRGSYDEAAIHFRVLLDLNPRDVKSLTQLGIIAMEKGELERALFLFDRANSIDSTSVETRENLASVLRRSGRVDESTGHLEWVLEHKKDAPSSINLARAYHTLGRYEEAVDGFTKAIELAPLSFKAYNDRGISLLELGRFDDAEVSFKNAITIRKNYAEPHFNLGNLYRQTGKPKEAGESYRRFLELWQGSETMREKVTRALENLNIR